MKKVQRFQKDIMAAATYYEVLDYVADYVQVFLQEMLTEKIKIPVSADKILQELEIPVECSSWEMSLAMLQFSQGKPYIYMKDKFGEHSDLANWLKVKCLAGYILDSDVHHVTDRMRNITSGFEEFLLEFPRSNGILANVIAYEIMLPWKQAIAFLLEKDFCNKVSDLWRQKGILAIGEAISMDYPNSQKIFAYYHFIQTIEAKYFLKTIEKSQYEEIQKKLMKVNEVMYEHRIIL